MTRITTFLLLTLLLCINVPVVDSQPESNGNDVINKPVKEQEIKDLLVSVGIDPKTVILERDYGVNSDSELEISSSLACSRTYLDKSTGQQILIIGNLPYVDSYGNKVETVWEDRGSYFRSKQNTFVCVVVGDLVTIVAEDDEGDIEDGDTLQFRPQIFLDGKEVYPESSIPVLLGLDPINTN